METKANYKKLKTVFHSCTIQKETKLNSYQSQTFRISFKGCFSNDLFYRTEKKRMSFAQKICMKKKTKTNTHPGKPTNLLLPHTHTHSQMQTNTRPN